MRLSTINSEILCPVAGDKMTGCDLKQFGVGFFVA